jgi:hypothetical protein
MMASDGMLNDFVSHGLLVHTAYREMHRFISRMVSYLGNITSPVRVNTRD